jgi:hypothetical protein
MILRLDPPIPLDSPKGFGWSHFLIDYSTEHNFLWQVFIAETGESWIFQNRDIRLQANPTMEIRRTIQDLK